MPPGTQDAERIDSRFTDEDADAARGSLLDSDDDEEEIHACLHTGIEPLGVLTIPTHGRGDLLPGSVKVTSDRPIGGFLRFSLPDIGVAGVGVSHPVRDALFPARRQAGGIRTAAAIHNLEEEAMVVNCRLMKAGIVLEEAEIPLMANGQEALYIEEMFTRTDTSDFVGSVRCMVPSGGGGAVHRRGPGNGPRHLYLRHCAGVSGSRDAVSGINGVSAQIVQGERAAMNNSTITIQAVGARRLR